LTLYHSSSQPVGSEALSGCSRRI